MNNKTDRPRREPVAIRFSRTMADLDPGVRIVLRWLRCVLALVLVLGWPASKLLAWL